MKSMILTALFALTLAYAQKVPHFLYITTPILEPDAVVAGTLDEEGGQNLKDGSRLEVVQGRFTAGEALEFRLTSTFDGYLTIYAPDKTVLSSNDDTDSEEETYLSSIITEIPETGRYVFIISGYSEFDFGDYELSATRLEVSEDGPITLPTELSGILGANDDFAEFNDDFAEFDAGGEMGSLGEFNYDSFTFELREAATVRIEAASPALDTIVQVLDAEGNTVAFNDDQNPEDDPETLDIDESLDYTTDAGVEVDLEPGTYEIRVAAYSLGFYTLSVFMVE